MCPSVRRGAACVALLLFAPSWTLWGQDESLTRWTADLGGGFNFPRGKTNRYVTGGEVFAAGAGYRYWTHTALMLQYGWYALPLQIDRAADPSLAALQPESSLISITANLRTAIGPERIATPYVIGGGGWYRRVSSLSTDNPLQPIVCSGTFLWWNYPCEEQVVPPQVILSRSTSDRIGVNGGAGIRFHLWRASPNLFVEARYHWAPHPGVATSILPVTVGVWW